MRVEELINKINNFVKSAKSCCKECSDEKCCVNAAAIEKIASDENCAKCEGYKKPQLAHLNKKHFAKDIVV